MDLETACNDLKELGVIDEKMILAAITDQGPRGEKGRLFKQQGMVYEEITYLRLEYLDILKIDHLWMLTGLKKLQLSNNLIEKIENLHVLVNLEDLDLSFNCIEKIENLNALKKLEVLTLFQNKIKTVENLEGLPNLTILSIGNNSIASYDSVLYLRKLDTLKSLNMAGNPLCNDENFVKFVMAYLPQLVYYEYRMISKAEKAEARELFLNSLLKLERDESENLEVQLAALEKENLESVNAEAFVERIGGDQLFFSLFDKDFDCKTLLQMGENTMDLYNGYKKNFTDVTDELLKFGISQLEQRQAEISRFEKSIGEAKRQAFEESRAIAEEFIDQKATIFEQIKETLGKEVDDDDVANEVSLSLQLLNENFKSLCHRTWNSLMKKELNLFEGMEEVNATYERCLTEMVNLFVEGVQAQFTQLRQLQNAFNESLTDAANKFFTSYTVATATNQSPDEYRQISPELMNLMQDKEFLTNALSASHDYHLMVIDQREDTLVTKIKNWLSNLLENLTSSEVNRHRTNIIEINHFLDVQKAELQDLLMTPVGLHLLPQEIQDALQL